jgi:hypothetical protein
MLKMYVDGDTLTMASRSRFSQLFSTPPKIAEELSAEGMGKKQPERKAQARHSGIEIWKVVLGIFDLDRERKGEKAKQHRRQCSAPVVLEASRVKGDGNPEEDSSTAPVIVQRRFSKQNKEAEAPQRKRNRLSQWITSRTPEPPEVAAKVKVIHKHDSKLSSPSPSPIPTPPRTPGIVLTPRERDVLLHHLSGMVHRLRRLEYQTAQFSNNVGLLLARKERSILRSRRYGEARARMLLRILSRVRNCAAGTFGRKMVVLQRALRSWGELGALLEGRGGGGCEGWDERGVREAIQGLRDDLRKQKELDEILRVCIEGATGDERVVKNESESESERLAVRRFVSFVRGRMGRLAWEYSSLEKAMRHLDNVLGTLGKGEIGE